MDNLIIGNKIRIARQHRQLSIDKLSERCGITEKYLGNIERGEDSPSLKALLNIVNELQLSLDYVLGDDLKYNVLSERVSEGDMRDNLLQQINTLNLKQQESVAKFIAIIKEYKE